MSRHRKNISGSVILRVSGSSINTWMEAANPDLFSRIRNIDALRIRNKTEGERLAEMIGNNLIPDERLSREIRNLAIHTRRQIHNAIAGNFSEVEKLASYVRDNMPDFDPLITAINEAFKRTNNLIISEQEITDLVYQEDIRLPKTAWNLVHSRPFIKDMFLNRNSGIYNSIMHYLGKGNSWNSKELRRKTEYIWQMLDRASTKSTPRDWHGQVALMNISKKSIQENEILLAPEIAMQWAENIHLRRTKVSGQDQSLNQRTRIALTPLHWATEEELFFLVFDAQAEGGMTEIRLKRSSLINAIYLSLAYHREKAISTIEKEIQLTLDEDSKIIRYFIKHLLHLGIIQVSIVPDRLNTKWDMVKWPACNNIPLTSTTGKVEKDNAQHLAQSPAGDEMESRKQGYIDVYRRSASSLKQDRCYSLQGMVNQTLRILASMAIDTSSPGTSQVQIDAAPKPLLELFRETVESQDYKVPARRQEDVWPLSNKNFKPYSLLLERISSEIDNSDVINFNETLLDEIGMPTIPIDWPIDCVFRLADPNAGFEAVLDEIFVAGSMDARFIRTLTTLSGKVPNAERYTRLLDILEEACDIRFTEILIPPHSIGAANAIERPLYTNSWTGDPDIRAYCKVARSRAASYIPLHSITIRRTGKGLIAESNGKPICPLYHATRVPVPPWNIFTDTLLQASPIPMRWARRRIHSLFNIFPERTHIPRICIDGKLVLSCAHWQIASSKLWQVDADMISRIRKLDALRAEYKIPRWVFVSGEKDRKPRPCDMESIRAIDLLEKFRNDQKIFMTEMLPAPDQLLVRDKAQDKGDRVASELLLRFPADESVESMAERIIPGIIEYYKS